MAEIEVEVAEPTSEATVLILSLNGGPRGALWTPMRPRATTPADVLHNRNRPLQLPSDARKVDAHEC